MRLAAVAHDTIQCMHAAGPFWNVLVLLPISCGASQHSVPASVERVRTH